MLYSLLYDGEGGDIHRSWRMSMAKQPRQQLSDLGFFHSIQFDLNSRDDRDRHIDGNGGGDEGRLEVKVMVTGANPWANRW